MPQKLFYQFDPNEQDEFISACERHGYVYEDFDVVANDALLNGAGEHQREISVARFDRIRMYLGSEGPIGWLREFETDLARGSFSQM
ncbi:hypothetical protein [Silvimonas amylolytica]|uniref:Uncharacterized protein n=1 Tax=Silvimonas amylolytica TaxID=449663 RepID=A0ABQ2PGX2_9NEIS|nr:hypothetical protein [Silvimonas amylolytica]GGP24535.1 hypothetical protein GCM10010971_03540 [Silvimonas amylolytica]